MTELVNVELAIVHCVAGVLQQSGILKKNPHAILVKCLINMYEHIVHSFGKFNYVKHLIYLTRSFRAI